MYGGTGAGGAQCMLGVVGFFAAGAPPPSALRLRAAVREPPCRRGRLRSGRCCPNKGSCRWRTPPPWCCASPRCCPSSRCRWRSWRSCSGRRWRRRGRPRGRRRPAPSPAPRRDGLYLGSSKNAAWHVYLKQKRLELLPP